MTSVMAEKSNVEVRPRFPDLAYGFNPEVDLQEVDQFGFVNLNEAFENGIVPSFADASDESFNGVQNPGTLIPRHQDVFDGLRKAEYVRGQLDKLNAEEREKVERRLANNADSTVVTE